jgi:hypothetical protein
MSGFFKDLAAFVVWGVFAIMVGLFMLALVS